MVMPSEVVSDVLWSVGVSLVTLVGVAVGGGVLVGAGLVVSFAGPLKHGSKLSMRV